MGLVVFRWRLSRLRHFYRSTEVNNCTTLGKSLRQKATQQPQAAAFGAIGQQQGGSGAAFGSTGLGQQPMTQQAGFGAPVGVQRTKANNMQQGIAMASELQNHACPKSAGS